MSLDRQAAIECLLALALILAAVAARRSRTGIAVLAVLSVTFPLADQAWEGATLIGFSPEHGFTVADLLGVAGLVWAGVIAWRWERPAPPSAGPAAQVDAAHPRQPEG